MKRFVTAAFVVVSAALAGACYSHTREIVVREPTLAVAAAPALAATPMPPSNTPVAPLEVATTNEGDENPTRYASDVRARMDRIEDHVRAGIHHGHVSPAALDEVTSRRAYVEELLSQYSADGRMGHHERRQIDRAVDDMRNIHDRYEMNASRAIGGGPYFYNTP